MWVIQVKGDTPFPCTVLVNKTFYLQVSGYLEQNIR